MVAMFLCLTTTPTWKVLPERCGIIGVGVTGWHHQFSPRFNRSVSRCEVLRFACEARSLASAARNSACAARSIACAACSLAIATSESARSWSLSDVIRASRLNNTSPRTPIVTSRLPSSEREGQCPFKTQSAISSQYSTINPTPTSQPNISAQNWRDFKRLPSVLRSLLLGPLIRCKRGKPSKWPPVIAFGIGLVVWLLSRSL